MAPIHLRGPAFDPDQAILSDYQWDEYKALSPAMGEAIEGHVLKELAAAQPDGPSGSSLWGPSVEQCQRLLRNDRNFRRLFLHCWKMGSFDEIRRDERYQSLIRAGTSTPASATSWEDVDGCANREEEYYAHNTLTPATDASHSKHVTIYDSAFNNVEGDFWQVNYFNDRHKDVAEWLCETDYRPVHHEVSRQREKNTGEWFLHSAEFRNWVAFQDHQVLWCPGIPGVGKTVLASLAVNHLQANETNAVVTFIYFDYKQQNHQNLLVTLGALARQIYETRFSSPEASAFETLYQSHRAQKDPPALKELETAIAISLTHFKSAFIVIDALDEYLETHSDHQIRELLQLLLSLSSTVKLLVTSRILGEMEKTFSELRSIRRQIHAFEEDVQAYIKGRITSGSFSFLPSADLAEQVVETVTSGAKGRFLLAKLHMNSLAQHSNAGDVRDALQDLPDGIDETYAEAMERIERQTPRRKDLAIRTLMWIAYGHRPLWIKELQHALATRPGAASTDDYLTDPSFITASCAGLVIIEDGSDIIRFVHVTVQEYFARNRHQHFPYADQRIARTCIDYLSLTCFNVQGNFDWGDHPFYEYAALEWGYHAQHGDQELNDQVVQFLSKNDSATSLCLEYILYRELFDWYSDDGPGSPVGCGIFIAIYHNQSRTLSRLLDNIREVPLTREGRNPFLFAARLGKPECVKLMLERQQASALFSTSGIGEPDRSGRRPLSYAAAEGHEKVVELLLNVDGVSADLPDHRGTTALSEAASRNHTEIVSALLRCKTAQVNAKDDRGLTALSLAARAGHYSVVEALLGCQNIDPDTKDCNGGTPLSHAVEQACDGVVGLLLSNSNVDINSQDNHGRTVLSWAVGNWSSEYRVLQQPVANDARRKPASRALIIVELLLQREDLKINLVDKWRRKPIYYALQMGFTEVVKLLNEHGAERP